MSEYIITIKQLAIFVAKCHGVKLVNADGTPICDAREISEVVDEPITLKEIVRCRDCSNYYEVDNYHPQGNYISRCCKYFDAYFDEVSPDGFCAWGERGAEK